MGRKIADAILAIAALSLVGAIIAVLLDAEEVGEFFGAVFGLFIWPAGIIGMFGVGRDIGNVLRGRQGPDYHYHYHDDRVNDPWGHS